IHPANQVVHRRGIDVHSTYDHHVVGPAQHSALDSSKRTPAFTGLRSHFDEVSRPVSEGRHARAAEACDDKLTAMSFGDWLEASRIDHLKDELGLVQMYRPAASLAAKAPAPRLACARVVKARCTPAPLDRASNVWKAGAGFARVNADPDR